MKFKCVSPLLFIIALLSGLPDTALATQFTYTPDNAATDTWSTGTDWNAVPVSASTTELTFVGSNGTVQANSLSNTNTDNIAGNFSLNILDLNGTGPASGAGSITIAGNPLNFVANGSTNPIINLNALAGTAGLTYTVSNNIILGANTTFDGSGTAHFDFTGALTGTGNLTLNAGTTGTTLTLGTSGTNNGGFASYTGNMSVTEGTLSFAGGFISAGSLNIGSSGTVNMASGFNTTTTALAFTGLTGTGTLSTSTGGGTIYLDYTGAATNTFSGALTLGAGGIILTGSGNVTLPAISATTTALEVDGSGTVTLPGVTGSSAQIGLQTQFSTLVVTNNSGIVAGGGTWNLRGGTLDIAPTGSSTSTITLNGPTATSSLFAEIRPEGGNSTIELNRGTNAGVDFNITNAKSTPVFGAAYPSYGTLVIDPGSNGSLGTTVKLTASDTAISTKGILIVGNTGSGAYGDGTGMIAPNIVTSVSGGSADFLTYIGNGSGTTDTGLTVATYNTIPLGGAGGFYGDNFNTDIDNVTNTSAPSAGNLTGGNLSGTPTNGSPTWNAFGLRDSSTINLGSNTLELGQNSVGAGLILNGGTISGGTVAFEGTGYIYVSTANGTISSTITNPNSGNELVKFGPGTLYLTGTNNNGQETIINSGALDVGTLTGGTTAGTTGSLGSAGLALDGGVLEGNGTFNRPLGGTPTGTFTVTWGNGGTSNIQDSSPGGGFAAAGGTLTVDVATSTSNTTPVTLVWGNGNFLTDDSTGDDSNTGVAVGSVVSSVLMFGATTANNQVIFQNPINLGNDGLVSLEYRQIDVNGGTSGTASANLTGLISSTDPHGILKTGTGSLILSNSTGNTYSGGTVVSAGTLQLANTSNSATGSGSLVVNAGATLAGTGISSGSSFSISGTGTTTAARANVLVGQTQIPTNDTNTTSSLTLIGSGASTIANANLTFNLNSAVAGGLGTNPTNSGNELSVGATPTTFGLGTQSTILTLNLQGASIIAPNTPYVLVAGLTTGGADQYTNLSLGTGVTNGAVTITPILNSNNAGSGNLTLAFSTGAAGYYGANSYLFLYQNSSTGADDIEVEVVPEPGTWALMLGGLALLIIIQRRRKI